MKILKKVWKFIWEDDSVWSWILNIILAFLIIKFILYPGLGWALGTPAPIVAVVSGSMEHDGNFDEFWSEAQCCNAQCSHTLVQGEFYDQNNISKSKFKEFGFVNGFNKGDIMILYSPKSVKLGDTIVYLTNTRPDPIIHRVIAIEDKNGSPFYWTKGDHNCDIGEFEKGIPQDKVIGKAVWRVPLLGWVKIVFVDLINLVR
jgi:signal peptidase I